MDSLFQSSIPDTNLSMLFQTILTRIETLAAHFVFAIMLLLPISSWCGENRWTSSGPYGGQVTAFAFHPRLPSVIFAINHFDLFKSTTRGTTWQRVKVPFASSVAVHFSPKGQRLFVATGRSLFFTSDLGMSWQKLSDFPILYWPTDFAFHSNSPSIVYVLLGSGGFFRSLDEGKTWENRSTGLPANGLFFSLVVDPKNGDAVYLSVDYSVYKTENGGASWTRIATLDGYGYLYSLAIHPRNSSVLYSGLGSGSGCVLKSTNGGKSWQNPNCNSGVSSLAIDPHKPQIIFAAGDFLQRSLDGGISWQILQTPPRHMNINLTVAVHPLLPGFVFVGDTGNGVFRSIDGGNHWNPVNRGMNSLEVRPFAIGEPGKLFTAGENWQMYQKSSEQSSWMLLESLMTKRVEQIAVHPKNPKLIALAGDFTEDDYDPSGSNVAVSIDGGASWRFSKALQGGICCFFKVLSFHSQNPDILFMSVFNSSGAFAGVAKSTDQGRTWKLSNAGLTNPRVVKMAVGLEPGSPIFVLTERRAEIYRTENAAESWQKISMPLQADEFPADIVTGFQALYASTITPDLNSYIYFSPNRGRTWIRRHQFPPEGNLPIANLAVDVSKPSTLFVYNSFGKKLFKSSNGGQNWSAFPRPPINVFDMIVDPYDHQMYHLATNRGVYSYLEGN